MILQIIGLFLKNKIIEITKGIATILFIVFVLFIVSILIIIIGALIGFCITRIPFLYEIFLTTNQTKEILMKGNFIDFVFQYMNFGWIITIGILFSLSNSYLLFRGIIYFYKWIMRNWYSAVVDIKRKHNIDSEKNLKKYQKYL